MCAPPSAELKGEGRGGSVCVTSSAELKAEGREGREGRGGGEGSACVSPSAELKGEGREGRACETFFAFLRGGSPEGGPNASSRGAALSRNPARARGGRPSRQPRRWRWQAKGDGAGGAGAGAGQGSEAWTFF